MIKVIIWNLKVKLITLTLLPQKVILFLNIFQQKEI